MWSEVASVYPCRWNKIKYFNAGMSMNLVTSMLRPLFPEDVKQKLDFGCQSEQRLDTLYLVPSLEEANARFLGRVEESLRRHHHNASTFTL